MIKNIEVTFEPIKPSSTSVKHITVSDVSRLDKNVKSPTAPTILNHNYVRDQFIEPPWNIPEIVAAIDVESYVREALDKKHGLAFKEGYYIGGREVKAVEYLKARYMAMEHLTESPMRQLKGQLLLDLFVWGNAFLVKKRDVALSPGMSWVSPRWGIMKPIAGMYYAPARTMWPKLDKTTGQIVAWKQNLTTGYTSRGNNGNEWSARDVVHFKFHHRGLGGVPELLPVLSDIQVLRRIEEDVTLLIMKYLFPFLHVKIGSDAFPAKMLREPDGSGGALSEIDWLKSVIENADPSEGIVTDHRVEIETVGVKNTAMDVEPYLKYFQARVFSGLGMSPIDFGMPDTANRSTGETISRNTLDTVRRYQSDFQWQWNWYVDRELLMEEEQHRKALQTESWETYAGLRWPDPDIDMRIKKDNYYTDMFTKSVITLNETRDSMGRGAMSEEEFNTDTHWSLIDRPKAVIVASGGMTDDIDESMDVQVEAQKAIEKAKPRPTSGTKTAASNKSVSSKNRPSNQHGKKSGPAKSTKDEEADDMFVNVKVEEKDISSSLMIEYDTVAKMFTDNQVFTDAALDSTMAFLRTRMIDRMKVLANHFYSTGIETAVQKQEENQDYSGVIERWAIPRIDRIITALTAKIKSSELVSDAFNSLRYRVDFLSWSIATKSLNYARVVQARRDRNEVTIDESQSESCEQCKSLHGTAINTSAFTLDELPPHHPKCKGSIRITKRTNKG